MLFLISTFYLSNTFPEFQPVTRIGLPEGAKARLGKGYISGNIAYSPDGTRLVVASSAGVWLYDAETGEALDLFITFPVLSAVFSPDRETIASAGWDNALRLNTVRFRVHISPTLRPLPYLTAIRYAMNTWESATSGKIRFQETETPEQADIRVNPIYSGRLAFLDTRLGSAKLTWLSQDTSTAGQGSSTAINFAVEIVLMLEGDGTIGALSEEEMQTVCLHEFGHAIGL